MNKQYTISVSENNELKLTQSDLTVEEALELTFVAMEIYATAAHKQAMHTLSKDDPLKNHEKSDKEIRGRIYDLLVVKFSDVANVIFPEHIELNKKTPEALLAELDAKVNAANRQE